jgi:RNA polymerase sigma-70 factor (ECF subfamily)
MTAAGQTRPMPATEGGDAAAALDVVRVHEAHADFVYITLQRLGVPDADLEDLLQEVFLVVHRKLPSFDGACAVRTWLFGICRKVAAGRRNRASTRREEPTAQVGAQTVAEDASPEDAVMAGQDRARLAEVLDAMDPERRAMFVMFELDEMGCEEIAAVAGVPLGTVYSRLFAARRDFQQAAARVAARDAWHATARRRGAS